jgi:hypothetical protein
MKFEPDGEIQPMVSSMPALAFSETEVGPKKKLRIAEKESSFQGFASVGLRKHGYESRLLES